MKNQPDSAPSAATRALSLVYFLHLAVPAFLLADILVALLRHKIPFHIGSNVAVGAISGVWLALAISLYGRSHDRVGFLRKCFGPLMTVYTFYVAAIFMEGAVRLMGFTPPIPAARTPSVRAITKMDPAVWPGVSGIKKFTTNSLGLRGPMPSRDDRSYKIVAIGGSTTICANLDDSEEWPHLTMEKLNAAQSARHVWVGNAGIAATNTVHHLVLMQWLPGVLRPNMVVFLFGVNDLTATLAFEGGPTQAILEKQAQYQGELPPGTHWRMQSVYPVYRRLRIFLLLQTAGERLRSTFSRPKSLPLMDIRPFRERRIHSPVLPLPDLTTGLDEYGARIRALADRCKDLQMRCLFLTQPSMWRDNLGEKEDHLFWQGYLGRWDNPKGYLSSVDMARAMALYNRKLLDVCAHEGLECYDIAADIPKDLSAFFDEMHFNESGGRMMAQRLSSYLLSHPPFRKEEASRVEPGR